MLVEKMAAHALGRAVRSHEVEAYRVGVRDVLPHVPADQREAAALGLKLAGGELLLELRAPGRDGVRLTATPQHLGGLRWWFACPLCKGRTTSLYWHGRGRVGAWKCRGCARVRYSSSALHRTVEGDRALLQGEIPFRSEEAVRRALARYQGRRARLYTDLGVPPEHGEEAAPDEG